MLKNGQFINTQGTNDEKCELSGSPKNKEVIQVPKYEDKIVEASEYKEVFQSFVKSCLQSFC